ncbi:MAG: ATP-binding protein [bacterium]
MYIKRKIEDVILRYIEKPEIIAIVGPRQCGKTTLLRKLYDSVANNAVFITFEDKKVLDLFDQDIDGFIEQYIKPNKYLFIDEFQYSKKGGKLLKYIYDLTASKTKVFISGSSVAELTVRAIKHLVGRIFVFNLYTFDFEEFLVSKDKATAEAYHRHKIDLSDLESVSFQGLDKAEADKLKNYYNEYSIYGGYPRVVLSADAEEKKEVLKNIFNTYFLREVKDILGLIDDYKLAKMIKALALQIGNLIEYNEIGQTSEFTYQTIKKYLNFMAKTFICAFPKPFFRNKRKEIVKNPKVYFFDTGLRNYILNDFRRIDEREDAGFLLENAAAMQILKRGLALNFWRTKQKQEIDFIVDLENNKRVALEIKKTAELPKTLYGFQRAYPEIPIAVLYYHGELANNMFPVYCL